MSRGSRLTPRTSALGLDLARWRMGTSRDGGATPAALKWRFRGKVGLDTFVDGSEEEPWILWRNPYKKHHSSLLATQMIKGLGVCPSKHGLKELRLFSLERGRACMVRGLSYSLQEQEGCSLSDEKQLFPASAEDGRRVGLRLQVSLRSRSPESSRHRSRKRSGHFSVSEWRGLLSFMVLLTRGLFMTLKSIRETIQ